MGVTLLIVQKKLEAMLQSGRASADDLKALGDN